MTRDAIDTALFQQIAGTSGWVTSSQTLRLWKDVSATEMPAFFLSLRGEEAKPLRTGPVTKWTRFYDAWIYVNHDGTGNPAMKALAASLDLVEERLRPIPGAERQTLGGLVYVARLEGTVETDEGSLGDQAIAVMPITVIVSP